MPDSPPPFEPALLAGLQLAIGHEFRNEALLRRALTHRSFANESGANESGGDAAESRAADQDNERLEFLGDAVLELCVSEWLYENFPRTPEGELTQMRARVVNARTLAAIARNLHVGGILRVGIGEERSGGRTRRSLLADALEALLGAVFLDAGHEGARKVVRRLFGARLRELAFGPPKEPKSFLQEWAQATHRLTPKYRVVATRGPDHEAVFEAEVTVGDLLSARGRGLSKKDAQREAAEAALRAAGVLD